MCPSFALGFTAQEYQSYARRHGQRHRMCGFGWEVISVLLRTWAIFFFAGLAACLWGCAANSALTLMEASKHTDLIVPNADVIEQELKGRSFNTGKVYLESDAKVQTPESYSEDFFVRLIQHQVSKGFSNAGLEKGCVPACAVHVGIEEMKFTRGMFIIPDPSILRVKIEVRNFEDRLLIKGEFESRELPTIPIVLPGVVGVLPVALPDQEWSAVARMIPAVAIAITRTMVGLQQGKELSQIEVYPEALAAGGVIVPGLFLRGSPYGISPLGREEFERARRPE
jgi:hypothetical protein